MLLIMAVVRRGVEGKQHTYIRKTRRGRGEMVFLNIMYTQVMVLTAKVQEYNDFKIRMLLFEHFFLSGDRD